MGLTMRLPLLLWLAYADVKFWFVTLPVAIALALAAWYGAPWLGGLLWILIAAVALLTLPYPAAAALAIFQRIDATRYWRALNSAETIAGLPLPAGSKIRFADKTHSIPVSIELPHVTEIRGLRLTGTLRPWGKWGDADKIWGGILALDQRLDGLPCRAGPHAFDKFGGIMFDEAGAVHRCTLATEHELLGLKLPPGTTVSRGNECEPWSLLLPENAGVYIPALGTTAPPGVTLSIANDGRLVSMGSGHGQTIVVRNVPLNSKTFKVQGEVVASELAQPFAIAGETWPAGTAVAINLTTGHLAVTGK
jgi:hypothetical protein